MLIRRGILSVFRIFFFALIMICNLACREVVRNGHYEGSLFQLENKKAEILPVRIDVSYPNKNAAKVEVENAHGQPVAILDLKKARKKVIDVNLLFSESNKQMSFRLKSSKGCYVQEDSYHIEFCIDLNNFILTVNSDSGLPVLTLSGTRFDSEEKFEIESPHRLTLSEAIEIALEKNFESKLEYHKYKQAKYSALGAFLSLTPRLNLGSVIWGVGSDLASLPVALIAGIGDFAPFLLPNRWIQAFSARHMRLAELTTLNLMRANLASQVEGLVYIYEQERRKLEIYSEMMSLLKTGFETTEFNSELELMMDAFALKIINLEEAVRAAKSSVAMTLGYHNPNAIEELDFNDELRSISNSAILDLESSRAMALSRSFELRQLDFVAKATKLNNIANWFTLFDPQGIPDYSLGPGSIVYQIAANAKIKELSTQRELIQTTIFHQAAANIAGYNNAIRAYPFALKLRLHAENQLQMTFKKSKQNSTLKFEDFEKQVEKYISARLEELEIITNFRISRSKVDRMLLQEYYLKTLPRSEAS